MSTPVRLQQATEDAATDVAGSGARAQFTRADDSAHIRSWSPFELVGTTYPGILAFADDDTLIYPAWPTEGEAAVWTTASPVAGKKQNRTLKIRRLGTDDFATILKDLDPRGSVSFGAR